MRWVLVWLMVKVDGIEEPSAGAETGSARVVESRPRAEQKKSRRGRTESERVGPFLCVELLVNNRRANENVQLRKSTQIQGTRGGVTCVKDDLTLTRLRLDHQDWRADARPLFSPYHQHRLQRISTERPFLAVFQIAAAAVANNCDSEWRTLRWHSFQLWPTPLRLRRWTRRPLR